MIALIDVHIYMCACSSSSNSVADPEFDLRGGGVDFVNGVGVENH